MQSKMSCWILDFANYLDAREERCGLVFFAQGYVPIWHCVNVAHSNYLVASFSQPCTQVLAMLSPVLAQPWGKKTWGCVLMDSLRIISWTGVT